MVDPETVHDALASISIQGRNAVKIADTLQGNIWRVTTADDDSVVVKLTKKEQHRQSLSIVNGKKYCNIKENIELEQSILKYLTQQSDCHKSIAKFIGFVETSEHFVLLQEDGGHSLFNFVQNTHGLISKGYIDIAHWKDVVKVIFKQIIDCIAYCHSKRVSHNDISLENFLINDVQLDVHRNGQLRFLMDDIRIRLCDFGLAELHTNDECLSNKHCGKTQYKSPEVIRLKKRFDAKKNDTWAAGVCLFMLSFGCPPWRCAHQEDEIFAYVHGGGHILNLLISWNLSMYIVDADHMELIQNIFKEEKERISVKKISQSPFLN